MQVHVYRSTLKRGLYVYLTDHDGLERLPPPVRRRVGRAEFALSFDLRPDRRLGSENPAEVLENLRRHGFHVQLPRDIEPELIEIAERASTDTQDDR